MLWVTDWYIVLLTVFMTVADWFVAVLTVSLTVSQTSSWLC